MVKTNGDQDMVIISKSYISCLLLSVVSVGAIGVGGINGQHTRGTVFFFFF